MMALRGLRIAVVGGGLMGHGIAQVFAAAGARVTIHDPDDDVLAGVRDRIADNLRALGGDPAPAQAVQLCRSLDEAVADAEWVFEAAPEDLPLKQSLFARLDGMTAPGSILASNTSVMRITDIATDVARPERVIGTHWWNPPYLVPLVEVVGGERSSSASVARTQDLLAAVGKTPVHVRRDVPGFVGNRLQHSLWREAFALVDEGVCDADAVDTVVKQSFGLRLGVLGPMENADLIGLDLTLAIHDYVLPHLSPPSSPAQGLRERVADGRLGMGSGEGWRRWDAESAQATRRQLIEHLQSVAASR